MARLHRRHLVTRGTSVHSLLERLRRRLRELGQPLRDAATTDVAREPGRANIDDAPQRRSELEPARDRQSQSVRPTSDPARLPQQPPLPASSRIKAAVLAKPRKSTLGNHPTSIFGPTATESIGQLRLCGAGYPANRNSPFDSEASLLGRPCAPKSSGASSVTSHWDPTPSMGHDPLQSSSPTSPEMLPLATEPVMPVFAGAIPLDGAASFELAADGSSISKETDHTEAFAVPSPMAHRLP